jgi:Tfp pilus assembly protein PilO
MFSSIDFNSDIAKVSRKLHLEHFAWEQAPRLSADLLSNKIRQPADTNQYCGTDIQRTEYKASI